MWRINREAVLLGAGPAALLLQLAHPLVAEGVAHHSEFEADPWRPAARHAAHDAGSGLRRRGHGGSRRSTAQRRPRRRARPGRRPPGATARADLPRPRSGAAAVGPGDADLDQRASVRALGRTARARGPGGLLGRGASGRPAPGHPARARARATGRPSRPTGRRWSRRTGPSRSRPPRGAWPRTSCRRRSPGCHARSRGCSRCPPLALLPARIRGGYGLPWSPTRAALARGLDIGLRGWTAIMPASWRAMPQARAAARRVARHGRADARYDRRAATLRSEPNRA